MLAAVLAQAPVFDAALMSNSVEFGIRRNTEAMSSLVSSAKTDGHGYRPPARHILSQ